MANRLANIMGANRMMARAYGPKNRKATPAKRSCLSYLMIHILQSKTEFPLRPRAPTRSVICMAKATSQPPPQPLRRRMCRTASLTFINSPPHQSRARHLGGYVIVYQKIDGV
jgi:hypothetical protein